MSEHAGPPAAFVNAFSPPGIAADSYERLARASFRARVLVGFAALGVAGVLPGTVAQRLTFLALLGGLYLPYSLLILLVSKRFEMPAVRVAALAGDLLIVFAFQLLIPPTRLVSLFGYLLIVAFETMLGGIVVALCVSAAAMALTVVSEVLGPAGNGLSGYEMTMFGAVMAAMAVMMHAATREQRLAAQRLQQEIEERRRADELLSRSEAQLAEAQRIAHVGSWEWDIAADSVTWSDELYRIYGVDASRFTASYEGFLGLVHPDDREQVEAAIRRAFEEGTAFAFDHRVARPDGQVRILLAQGRVIRGADAAPTRMVGTAKDITERRQAELELQRYSAQLADANRELQLSNELKDHFLAVTNHELRTPLTAIMGLASTLQERWDELPDGFRRDLVGRIERQSERLRALVEDLLTLSRAQSNGVELNVQRVELTSVIRESLEHAGIPSAQVTISCPEGMRIEADPRRLTQILSNYLSNAAKYGACPFRIQVTEADECVEIRVADRGPGVPQEFLPRLFERFAQARTSGLSKGTGLGLAIVRELAQAHGGDAWYEPNQPTGACFGVRLPRRQPHRQPGPLTAAAAS